MCLPVLSVGLGVSTAWPLFPWRSLVPASLAVCFDQSPPPPNNHHQSTKSSAPSGGGSTQPKHLAAYQVFMSEVKGEAMKQYNEKNKGRAAEGKPVRPCRPRCCHAAVQKRASSRPLIPSSPIIHTTQPNHRTSRSPRSSRYIACTALCVPPSNRPVLNRLLHPFVSTPPSTHPPTHPQIASKKWHALSEEQKQAYANRV